METKCISIEDLIYNNVDVESIIDMPLYVSALTFANDNPYKIEKDIAPTLIKISNDLIDSELWKSTYSFNKARAIEKNIQAFTPIKFINGSDWKNVYFFKHEIEAIEFYVNTHKPLFDSESYIADLFNRIVSMKALHKELNKKGSVLKWL